MAAVWNLPASTRGLPLSGVFEPCGPLIERRGEVVLKLWQASVPPGESCTPSAETVLSHNSLVLCSACGVVGSPVGTDEESRACREVSSGDPTATGSAGR